VISLQGLISDFIAAGLVSPVLSPYGNDPAFEIESLTGLKPGGDRQLFTWPFEGGGTVHNKFSNQLWGANFGFL
jgi:hypothetical protein